MAWKEGRCTGNNNLATEKNVANNWIIAYLNDEMLLIVLWDYFFNIFSLFDDT